MNFGQLKDIIATYVKRGRHSLVSQEFEIDLVGVAINNAKTYAQRTYDFKYLKKSFKFSVPEVAWNNPTWRFRLTDEELGLPPIKKIISAIGNEYDLPIVTEQIFRNRKRARFMKGGGDADLVSCLVLEGDEIYLNNVVFQEGDVISLQGIEWLPDYENAGDTDFLMTYGKDYLLYKAMNEINYFLKEDERFGVSQKVLNDAWASLISWDSAFLDPIDFELEREV